MYYEFCFDRRFDVPGLAAFLLATNLAGAQTTEGMVGVVREQGGGR